MSFSGWDSIIDHAQGFDHRGPCGAMLHDWEESWLQFNKDTSTHPLTPEIVQLITHGLSFGSIREWSEDR